MIMEKAQSETLCINNKIYKFNRISTFVYKLQVAQRLPDDAV